MRSLVGLLAVCCLLLAGCATAGAQSLTVHQFAAQFDCPGAHVVSSPGGYRVDGCGRSAFYRCVKNAPPQVTRDTESKRGNRGGNLLEAIWETASAEASATVTCALEPSALGSRTSGAEFSSILPLTTTPHEAALTLDNQNAPLTLSLTLASASLALFADPVRNPDYVLITMRSSSLALYQACKPWLFHDGMRLTVSAMQLMPADRVHWVVPSRELRRLRHSTRVDGNVCGLRFALDPPQRAELADFAVRLAH